MSQSYHSIIPAVWMIIKNNQNQVYLLQRANTGWRDGWWTAPAGHVEPGESPSAAAIRELREEADVTVSKEDLSRPLVYFYPADDGTHERVSVFYIVTTHEGEPKNNEPQKASDAGWFDIQSLPDTTIPLLKQAIVDNDNGIVLRDDFYNDDFFKDLLR